MQYVSQKARSSDCGRYRYSLSRRWEGGSGRVLFIGLNPSTADHRRDDPTIRRCVRFARDWGFAEMEVVNLFAFRATYPRDLRRASDPVGPANDRILRQRHRRADLSVACWGNDGAFLDRASVVRRQLDGLHCIRLNASSEPAHPLYLRASLTPIPMP